MLKSFFLEHRTAILVAFATLFVQVAANVFGVEYLPTGVIEWVNKWGTKIIALVVGMEVFFAVLDRMWSTGVAKAKKP